MDLQETLEQYIKELKEHSLQVVKLQKDLKGNFIPYQKCPICNGEGYIVNVFGTTSSLNSVCSTCNGAKLILMFKVK